MAAMKHSAIDIVKSEPERFLDFLRSKRYGVYHRSNLFFRDIQYGLWRFLQENQSKLSYADMERLTQEVVDDWEHKGMLKRINRQSFELNMPDYLTPAPVAQEKKDAGTPKKRPVPPSAPAGDAARPSADDAEKAAKIAELQARMAAAKAKERTAEAAPVAPPSAPSPADDAEKAAKIAELQARMAAAKAKREAGEQQ